jgi:hypothetical protein
MPCAQLNEIHHRSNFFFSSFISSNSGEDDMEEDSNLAQYLPHFVWAVRDHHLKLEIDQEEVTATDYLEFCLKFRPGMPFNVFNILNFLLFKLK